jgi:hypothetical protein
LYCTYCVNATYISPLRVKNKPDEGATTAVRLFSVLLAKLLTTSRGIISTCQCVTKAMVAVNVIGR